MPSIAYSTGSSIVLILHSLLFRYCRQAYKVVVLPVPVGPVTRIKPLGRVSRLLSFFKSAGDMPSWSMRRRPNWRSQIRMVRSSPNRVEIVLIRRSSCLPEPSCSQRPSPGRRCSEMSIPAIAFTWLMYWRPASRVSATTCWTIPNRRRWTLTAFWSVSRYRSLARISAAWRMRVSTAAATSSWSRAAESITAWGASLMESALARISWPTVRPRPS